MTSNGRKAVVELLLAKGVNPDSPDNSGRTPLSLAAEKGHKEVADIMLATDGVEPNSKDKDGWTPLSWAASCGRNAAVKVLLAKGVDPDSKDNNDRTPLSLAAENGHNGLVKLLSERSNPNTWGKRGWTPLWCAAQNRHEKVVKLLIGRDSVTLHMLVRERNETLVQLLLHAGYDVDACDSNGLTPLRLAIRRKNPVLIEILLKYSANMEGIMAHEWLDAYASQPIYILQLAEGNNGVKCVRLPQGEILQTSAENERRLL